MTTLLFDSNGRRIPPQGIQGVVEPDRTRRIVQPAQDYLHRLGNLGRWLPVGSQLPAVDEFRKRSEDLLNELRGHETVSEILQGRCLPLVLPRVACADYGSELEKLLLATKSSYEEQWPGRVLVNQVQGRLPGQVNFVPESRHEMLLQRMREKPVVAIYFPLALWGYSIPAAREQMSSLPYGFTLSGAIEVAAAVAAYPYVLAREETVTPGIDCAANTWQDPSRRSLCFDWGGGYWSFTSRHMAAYPHRSGGLTYIG